MRLWVGTIAIAAVALPSVLAAQAKPAASPVPAPAAPAAQPAFVAERITVDELKKLQEADKVLVVDVRSAEAYKSGHIPGAVSAPLGEIDKHVPTLKSARKALVTYCT
jgi:3-mercaptopyruvate sulfurtransferase SseA